MVTLQSSQNPELKRPDLIQACILGVVPLFSTTLHYKHCTLELQTAHFNTLI